MHAHMSTYVHGRARALRYCTHRAVVDDLLSAFLGLSGSYIRAKRVDAVGGTRLSYEIITRGQLEPALQEMAARMLPLWWAGRRGLPPGQAGACGAGEH